MKTTPLLAALAATMLIAGCATKKGFEQPGYAFGCPIGEQKVGSMDDLVKAKTAMEGRRTTRDQETSSPVRNFFIVANTFSKASGVCA